MLNLRRYFFVTSAAVIIIGTVVFAIFYRQHAVNQLVSTVEDQNVTLAHAFANAIWPRFSSYVTSVTRADGDALRARSETQEIRDALNALVAGLPVLKVKIYNVDGVTVYSSQPSQIGSDKSNNLGFLKAARDGEPASKLSYRDTFSAFSGIVEDKDLVESYTPIRGRNGRIEGVFELYADVTPLVVRIGHNTTELAVILLLFFGLMFGCLFLIIERADLSEERYRELFDDSPVAIWEEDWSPIKQMLDDLARGGVEDWPGYFNSHRDQLRAAYDLAKITEVSRATVDIYGAASKEELLRWSTSASVIDEELDAFRETILSFLAGQMTVDIESKDTTVGESEIMVRRRVIIPPKYFNDWSRVIYAIEDDTERKRAEEALLVSEHALQKRVADLEGARRKLELQGESLVCLTDDLLIARDEARAADRAKSEFLAAMSHELRTPLNAIIGFSEIIKNETFGPVGSLQYREYTRDIHESGQHLLTLINDVLDLSKIDSGAAELHEDEISIAEAVRAVLKLVGHRAEQRGFKIELKLEDQLPALRADERKLKQILVNLLSNAVKFTDAGGEVTLRAWCRMDSGHVFQIVDTGIGIAPEDIPKALSRFRQVDSDLDRRFEGTGLGLPLTKDLVELHGGSLDLQSEVGVGTTVTVRLPAERIVALPDDTQSLDRAARKAS